MTVTSKELGIMMSPCMQPLPGPTGHYNLMIKRGCSESALARAYNRGPSRRGTPVPASDLSGDGPGRGRSPRRPRPRFVRNLNRG